MVISVISDFSRFPLIHEILFHDLSSYSKIFSLSKKFVLIFGKSDIEKVHSPYANEELFTKTFKSRLR